MDTPETIITELSRIFDAAVACLRADIAAFATQGTPPPERRHDGSYCYPELRIHFDGQTLGDHSTRSFGRLIERGTYACTVTRPALFEDYLAEQLALILSDYEVRIEVCPSRQEIPFPTCWTAATALR
jgi:AMP nucleosidase